ncbi:hypothetical protein SRHO_G00094750 [Serrasalmus rhombeus]
MGRTGRDSSSTPHQDNTSESSRLSQQIGSLRQGLVLERELIESTSDNENTPRLIHQQAEHIKQLQSAVRDLEEDNQALKKEVSRLKKELSTVTPEHHSLCSVFRKSSVFLGSITRNQRTNKIRAISSTKQ